MESDVIRVLLDTGLDNASILGRVVQTIMQRAEGLGVIGEEIYQSSNGFL
jgi:hypothetical protein